MILTVDAGNSRIKATVFGEGSPKAHFSFGENELQTAIPGILETYKEIRIVVVSSVSHIGKKAFDSLAPDIEIFFAGRDWNFPFENLYNTPETLGIDRMILTSGAMLAYPSRNCLIIDAGTCITYDFLDDSGNYHGGAISPGLRLRYEALHHYTAKLPLLEIADPEEVTGRSTAESIHSGVVNGTVNEIDGFIDYYKSRHSNFIIILTGGDADFLAKRLKNTIFAHSNFLLESLYHTYQFAFRHD